MQSVRNAVKLELKTAASSTATDAPDEHLCQSAFSKYDQTKTTTSNVICTAIKAKENNYCLFANTQDPATNTLYVKGSGVAASFTVSSKDGAYILRNT